MICEPFSFHGKICLGVPSARQRFEILETLLGEMEHALLDKDVHDLATATHGFVGADLAALCNEAALNCLREHVESKTCFGNTQYKPSMPSYDACLGRNGTHCLQDNEDLSSNGDFEGASSSISEACISSDIPRNFSRVAQTDTLRITFKDFERARMKIRPSAMREVYFTLLIVFLLLSIVGNLRWVMSSNIDLLVTFRYLYDDKFQSGLFLIWCLIIMLVVLGLTLIKLHC